MSDNIDDKMVKQIAHEAVAELRAARRWRIFFYSLFALYLLGFILIFWSKNNESFSSGYGKHTALIDIKGVISVQAEANADKVVTGLRNAFEDKNTKGVILRINSPGGSPVQAGYINDEIHRLRELHPEIPVYAVISDLCASGGYYIAAAADRIYADKASLIGSIGVIMSGFGFVDSIEKLGVERRLLTAGDNKGFLDPFSPLKHDEVQHVRSLLDDIHQQFIDVVKKGRGSRIQDNDKLFSGLIWTGEQAVDLGLIDALGSSSFVAREIVQADDIVDFTPKENYLDRFAESIGASIANTLSPKLELLLK